MMKRSLLFHAAVAGLVLIACSVMQCTYLAQRASRSGRASDSAAMKKRDTVVQSLPPLSPASLYAWKGEQFVLLEKGTGFSEFGYELYSCPKLDSCRDTVDTAKWTKSHRAKCSFFAGHHLKTVSVEQSGQEWLLVFRDLQTGDTLYARTQNGVYHEIAREIDLERAMRRWKDRVVFSVHGFINTVENGKSGIIRVRLQDPLRVRDVCFGVTPFPVKPIRLMVSTPHGRKGFIPVYYSWTNVNPDLIREGNPWDEDIFEVNPQQLVLANEETWRIINDHRIYIGMTCDQVRMSWGLPQRRTTATYKEKERECWIYLGQSLYFDDQKLIGSSAGIKQQVKNNNSNSK